MPGGLTQQSERELEAPAVYNVKVPTLEGANPMGMSSDPEIRAKLLAYQEAQKEYLKDLEGRFAQPNLWRVAAGFAKPTLGGFGAALGNAMQELGTWQEQRKAIQPTIAQLRAEIARSDIGLAQGLKSAKPVERAISEGRTPSAAETLESEAFAGGPKGSATTSQNIESAKLQNFLNAMSRGESYANMVKDLGEDFVNRLLPQFIAAGAKPPPGYAIPGATPTAPPPAPGVPGAPAAPSATGAAPAGEPQKTSGRIPIPGVDVNTLTEGQYLAALKEYNTLKQERYGELTKDINTQARGGQKVYETAQQIHDVASSPVLTPIFAQFEKGNPAGILGQMLESQGLSSVLANMRTYVTSARLGAAEKKDALTKLNQLENLMGTLQTEMQSAIINPSNLRTEYEKSSLPNLRNTQDAFLRGIRYVANEGLTKYENQFALERAAKTPQFDPMYWSTNPAFADTIHNSTQRRNAIVASPATQDRPAFMRGSIDEAAYRGQRKEKEGKKKLTAKELREQANKPD